jgi:transcription-repair coupling factor (superfamily II helicase)
VATKTTQAEALDELLVEAAGALAPSLEGDHVTASAPAAGHPFVAAAMAVSADAPVLAVAPDPRSAQALADGAAAWLGEERVVLFPAWESLPYEGISPGPLTAGRRAAAAERLRTATGPLVVAAPVLAVLQRIAPDLGAHEPLEISPGSTRSFDELLEALTSLGYSRVDVVEHRGEFAVRGGILDVFPATGRRPARAEFFGDEIESLREFSPGTQLSTGKLDGVQVHPCRELVVDRETRTRAEQALNLSSIRGQYRSILERLAEGLTFEGMEQAIPLLNDRLPFLSDLLPARSPVVLTHARLTVDRAAKVVAEADALAEASEWPGIRVIEEPATALGGRARVDVSELSEGTDLGIRPWEPGGEGGVTLAAEAARLHRAGTRIVVAAEGRGSLDRALEVLESAGLPPGEVAGVRADVEEGFSFERGRVALLSEEDLFGRRRHTREAPRLTQRRAESVAAELEPGDLCVHQVHGVGRYVGMVRRAVAGSERDYLLLEYAQGDRLYVPSDQVGVVTKYVGGEAPRVHRLGSSDWVRAKGRVRRAIRDMAGELVRLYSVRMSVKGHAFPPDTPWQMELEDAFPHEETRDQLAAIAEVKQDMESEKPMDRLICGDVGYGKTEIAVRAAFKAVMDGKQVAVLVPTTLLAEQHHVTFSERFSPFPVKVAMLSRFLSSQEQEQVVERVKSGEVDVVVGTHRLLSSDIKFKDLGLLIVDEEQRFGVTHKERLKKLRTSVDVLTMTATPIPRTLEMALAGIRDMSSVDTPPEDRQPVLTYVGSYEEDMALAAVRRELLRGGQVFWVHNRVETIGRAAGKLQARLPDANIATAHGQMDERTLEKVMMAFWDRTADVLVCTTIIESGLDVPSANTLVVERADRLGLAQMYQLRGRVGRSAERAFAYLFFPPQAKLTEEAHARLAAISRHTALGSGFQIAMKDLEIRGAGNLLGAEQHGHIAAVGFDTYVRLLAESVAEMKGEPVAEGREVRVDLPVRAFIPPEWLGQEALRLELYRRISMAGDHEELARVRAEAEDRFGRIPDEVRTLFAIQSLRIACLAGGIEEISTIKMQIRIKPVAPELGHALALEREDAVYHEVTRTLNLQPPNQFREDLLVGYVEDAIGGTEGAKEGA